MFQSSQMRLIYRMSHNSCFQNIQRCSQNRSRNSSKNQKRSKLPNLSNHCFSIKRFSTSIIPSFQKPNINRVFLVLFLQFCNNPKSNRVKQSFSSIIHPHTSSEAQTPFKPKNISTKFF